MPRVAFRSVARVLGAALGLVSAVGLASGAERTIPGKSLTVKDPASGADPAKRTVTVAGGETDSTNPVIGNPTLSGSAGGAILEIALDGAGSSNQAFVLPQGIAQSGNPFWTASAANFFDYSDPRGEQGPVAKVRIRRSVSGAFLVKAKLKGKNGPLASVPPNPGTAGCVALKLGIATAAGDRYSLSFAPPAAVRNDGARLFKVRRPVLSGVCPGL